jgi:amino acid adenylation domain-containing protein
MTREKRIAKVEGPGGGEREERPAMTLQRYLDDSARRTPDAIAVVDPDRGGQITYGALAALSDRVRDRLVHFGVRPGDRVALYLPKSIDTVAALFGALKAGAAYVPIDPGSPAWRAAYIMKDCEVRAAVLEAALLERITPEGLPPGMAPLVVSEVGSVAGLEAALDQADITDPAPPVPTANPALEALAYILYTSGSTGKPKGVMLSQHAGTSYVDWCSEVFQPAPEDRFSSHAPFHFDLSILDIFLPLKHGARLVLIGEELGKEPLRLAEVITTEKISVWYSTPSILNLLAQYGKLERHHWGALRIVLFAGEVFPAPQLRVIKDRWSRPAYFNLYGPTETNVCTWYRIPDRVPADRTEPYPIGYVCSHLRTRVVDPDGQDVPRGQEGELVVSGPGVMSGYWNLPEQNARAFIVSASGDRWYRTGDLVVEEADGCYLFHGRRDRMVKRRGFRVELGEIEAGLAAHPGVREVAVVARPDPNSGVRVIAHLAPRDGERLSIIELKRFSVERLPRYMTPDEFQFHQSLPKTSTDKMDYQQLMA